MTLVSDGGGRPYFYSFAGHKKDYTLKHISCRYPNEIGGVVRSLVDYFPYWALYTARMPDPRI